MGRESARRERKGESFKNKIREIISISDYPYFLDDEDKDAMSGVDRRDDE